jgi:CRISPR-associated protein (TIGR02584 family)
MTSPTVPSHRSVLVSVLGSTPAVLTETVWALAQETASTIPDEVVVVTTTHGDKALRQELLSPMGKHGSLTIWQALRKQILGPSYSTDPRLLLAATRIISIADGATGTTRLLDDIRTAEENAAAAECILASVRQYTTDPETRLIGLLAGGRKTMSALLHAAISLSGRSHDRLVHVLVNSPFDEPTLVPRFYFCGQPGLKSHKTGDGRKVAHEDASIELTTVPVVALGELVADLTHKSPATFASLSRAADIAIASARDAVQRIVLRFQSTPSPILKVNHHVIKLPRGRCAKLTEILWQRALEALPLLKNDELEESIIDAGHKYDFNGSPQPFSRDEVTKALSELRKAIRVGAGQSAADRLLPLRSPIGLNRHNVELVR